MANHYNGILVTLEGMHCTNCEIRLERALINIHCIEKVQANYINSELTIAFNANEIDLPQIIETIEALGYRVINSREYSTSCTAGVEQDRSLKYLLAATIIVAAAYLVANSTVGFGFLPQINQSMGYGLLFVVGLLTSIHCIGMCGGINISQSIGAQIVQTEGKKFIRMKPSILYNLGRVISYTLIGGLAGALGSVVTFSGTAKGIVAIIAGIFMVIMGLNMLNVFPWLRKFNFRLPKGLHKLVDRGYQQHGPLYVGLLNGLLPCGPLQAMQLYALGTASAIVGALSMMVFSLGTVPLMFGLGALSSFLNSKFKHRMFQISGVLILVLGIIMFGRGMNLSGINQAYSLLSSDGAGNVARVAGNVQVVNTTMESGRYTPIFVQKSIPVQWTITAADTDLNGCNNPVTIPKYDIEKTLVPGDNLIEFTPQEEGTINYTCWMGMISSTITVVADLSQAGEKNLQLPGPEGLPEGQD